MDDPLIREWVGQRDGRAESTKHGQRVQLERFLRKVGISQAKLLMIAKDERRVRRLADRFVDSEKRAGRRPAYALAVWYGVKSFLKSAGVPVAYNPSLTPEEMEPKDPASRRVPTAAELRGLLDHLSLRNRAVVLTLASSGVRIGVLSSGTGADGLRLENLPDLDLSTGKFEAKPSMVLVPARLSKNGKPYVTFLSTEAAETVETYLAERLRSGEKLVPRSPVFIPGSRGVESDHRTAEGFRILNGRALGDTIADNLQKVAPEGVRWTTHILRAWCSTQLELAESQGLISRTRREYFVGHTLGVDGAYNLTRPLSPEKREELRESYRKVERFLSTTPVAGHAGRDVETLKLVLDVLGVPEGALSETELREATPERFKEIVREHQGERPSAHQRVVSNGEISKLLGQGWQFVATLPDDHAILKPPEGA